MFLAYVNNIILLAGNKKQLKIQSKILKTSAIRIGFW